MKKKSRKGGDIARMKGRMLIACVLAAILCLPSAGTGREKPYLAAFGDSITTGFTLPGGRWQTHSASTPRRACPKRGTP